MIKKFLLICGILSSVWYIIINVIVPIEYDGYNIITQTVSELSAIHAPTRTLWIYLGIPYPLLFAAFGWGVLKSAAESRSLRLAGILIIVYAVVTSYWPPMQMRGNKMALTDILHIVWGSITVVLMIIIMISGALAFKKPFRPYTFFSIILFIVFGVLVGIEAPNIASNQSTPLIGVWERIEIFIFILWIAIFAVYLLKKTK